MHWVIQENLYNENSYNTLIQTLERMSIPFTIVKIIPFSHEIIPDINPDGLVYVSGATTLTSVAKSKGWTPGSFLNDNFDFSIWRERFGKENLLNGDAIISKLKDVNLTETSFMRPIHDTKTFSGMLIEPSEFSDWQQNVLGIESGLATLTGETIVLSSPPKHIMQEYRFFVVDGRLVTGSLYNVNGQVRPAISTPDIDPDIWRFAQKMVDTWQPAKAFAIDIARTEEGLKVIEINNINSTGFYACDVQKYVYAIHSMTF